jgi:hypothetical protein
VILLREKNINRKGEFEVLLQWAKIAFANSFEVQSALYKADSNIANQTVTSTLTSSIRNRGTRLSRALTLLLVVFILYGTTVEAAHRHGRVVPSGSNAAAVVDPGLAKNLASGPIGCSECLICQLHQNFSTTLITFRQIDAPAHLRTQFFDIALAGCHSITNAPRKGRSPPPTSLL